MCYVHFTLQKEREKDVIEKVKTGCEDGLKVCAETFVAFVELLQTAMNSILLASSL
jgi:hypothetical protein